MSLKQLLIVGAVVLSLAAIAGIGGAIPLIPIAVIFTAIAVLVPPPA